jgi:pyruvate formate lyase activating enzyme
VIPGKNDGPTELRALGRFVASLENPPSIDLLPYHKIGISKYTRLGRFYHLEDVVPPDKARMAEIAQLLRRFDVPVSVGGEGHGDD